jgi:hypothetical protein
MNSKPINGAGEPPGQRFNGCASFLEANGARINIPHDRNFETEGGVIESGLKRTIEGRDAVMRSLIRAGYRFRDATLVVEKKDDFGNALQNLYRELERAEDLVGPAN